VRRFNPDQYLASSKKKTTRKAAINERSHANICRKTASYSVIPRMWAV
jgi:NAD(P)H-nitrite reductase large subunit